MKMKKFFAVCLMSLSGYGLALAGEGSLSLQRDGQAVELAEADRARLLGQIEKVVVSSSVDSRRYPRIFRRHPLPAPEALAEASYLKVSYEEPKAMKTHCGEYAVKEVWILLREKENYPGPIYLVEGEGKVIHLGKYSGIKLVKMAHDDALHPHLPEQMRAATARAKEHVRKVAPEQNAAVATPQQ